MLAVSGIDSTIKIFSPDRHAQRDARQGRNLGVSTSEATTHPSLSFGARRRLHSDRQLRSAAPRPEDDPSDALKRAQSSASRPRSDTDEDDEDDGAGAAAATTAGLASRRRMHDSYQITSQNDVERQGGWRDAFITVSGPAFPLRTVPVPFAAWLAMVGGGAAPS